MSATRDKSQKATFVYSNLYQLYRKGKDAALDATGSVARVSEQASSFVEIPSVGIPSVEIPTERNVLKAGNLKFDPFSPPELIGVRLKARALEGRLASPRLPDSTPAKAVPESALSSLKKNLSELQNLHARLRFMLKEIEDMTRDSKN